MIDQEYAPDFTNPLKLSIWGEKERFYYSLFKWSLGHGYVYNNDGTTSRSIFINTVGMKPVALKVYTGEIVTNPKMSFEPPSKTIIRGYIPFIEKREKNNVVACILSAMVITMVINKKNWTKLSTESKILIRNRLDMKETEWPGQWVAGCYKRHDIQVGWIT